MGRRAGGGLSFKPKGCLGVILDRGFGMSPGAASSRGAPRGPGAPGAPAPDTGGRAQGRGLPLAAGGQTRSHWRDSGNNLSARPVFIYF